MLTLSIIAICLMPFSYLFGNWERGRGEDRLLPTNKVMIYLFWSTLLFTAILPAVTNTWERYPIIAPLLCLIGLFVGNIALFQPGWGKWFPQLTPTYHEQEGVLGKYLVDPLTRTLVGFKYDMGTKDHDVIKYKTVAFGIRHVATSIVKYATLAIATMSILPLVGILWCGFIGIVYRYVMALNKDDRYDIAESEKYSGLLIAAIDAFICLNLILSI